MKPETKRKKRIAKNQLYLFEVQESMSEQDYTDFMNSVQKCITENIEKIQEADEDTIKRYQNLSRQKLESIILQGKVKLIVLNPKYDTISHTHTQQVIIAWIGPLD